MLRGRHAWPYIHGGGRPHGVEFVYSRRDNLVFNVGFLLYLLFTFSALHKLLLIGILM
jgi:hypothetical protein